MSAPSLSVGHPQPLSLLLPDSGTGAFLSLDSYYGWSPRSHTIIPPHLSLALVSSLTPLPLSWGMSPGFPVVTDTHSSAELCLPQSRRVPHPHFILRWMTGRIHSISRELPADLIPLPDCQYQAYPPESEPSTVPDRLQSRGQCKICSPLFRMWGGNLVLVPVMSPLRLGHSTPCIQFKDKEPYFW